jgi:hypothetical protein
LVFIHVWCQEIGVFTRHSDNKIYSFPGITRYSYVHDWMHDCDVGPLVNLHGSCMDELVCEPAGSMEHCHVALLKELKHGYQEVGTSPNHRIGGLKLDHYHKPGDWSRLSAKAAHSRHLVPVMAKVLEGRGFHSERDFHRYRCYELIHLSLQILERNDMFLPDNEAELLSSASDYFLLHYNWLTDHYHAKGVLRYNFTMKNHYLWHCMDWARFLNPRFSWNYSFEGQMGLICRVSAACTAGTPSILTGPKTLQNVRLATFMRFDRQRGLGL